MYFVLQHSVSEYAEMIPLRGNLILTKSQDYGQLSFSLHSKSEHAIPKIKLSSTFLLI